MDRQEHPNNEMATPPNGRELDDQVARLLARNYSMLHAYVGAIVRDPHIAEEVLQETSLVILRKAAASMTAESLGLPEKNSGQQPQRSERQEVTEHEKEKSPWLFAKWARGVARREALKRLRERRRAGRSVDPAVLEAMEAAWSEWEDVETVWARKKALHKCLDRLAPKSREIIRLRYDEALSGKAMAQRLGRSLEGIYVTLSRIHKTLESCVRMQAIKEPGR